MNGLKEAALHFAQFLCSEQMITEQQPSIEKQKLKDVFCEMYQPRYMVQGLEVLNLVPALAKTGLLEKPPQSADPNPFVKFKWSRVCDLGFNVGQSIENPPARLTKPKQRVIVNPRYTHQRERQELPDIVSNEKCLLCNKELTPDTIDQHANEELHQLRLTYRKNRKEFIAKQYLMEAKIVDFDTDHSAKISCRVGVKYEVTVEFRNMLDQRQLHVVEAINLAAHKDVEIEKFNPQVVSPGEKCAVKVKVKFSTRGCVLCPVILKIIQSDRKDAEYFLKEITFLTQSEIMDQLAPTEPYHPPLGPVLKLKDAPIIPGKPSDRRSNNALVATSELRKMPFEIPPVLLKFLNNGFKFHKNIFEDEEKKLKQVLALLPDNGNLRDSLTSRNYTEFLELLLFIEEHQIKQDIHKYDMHNAVLTKNSEGLWLKVPGLSDKRPSLLINDRLLVNYVKDRSKCFEGFILRIVDGRVLLGLHDNFVRGYKGESVEVVFTLNRNAIRSMHIALYVMCLHRAQSLLFPSKHTVPIQQPPLKPWFNKSIEGNQEQQMAVRKIVYNASQNQPYLIFGPPGTGKTVTMVEAIMQLWDPHQKKTRLLVCTPSNSAADEVTLRVLKAMKSVLSVKAEDASKHILRMCAASRPLDTMPPAIQEAGISNHDRDGSVFYPSKKAIMSYDILICTFSTSARLVLAEIPSGHFTHILMDEVGQALEPEALIPLAGLATSNQNKTERFTCQVVMAGDPKQLGPILQSPIAAKFGLDKSMLERLMSLPLYSKRQDTRKYDPNVLTKLVQNYRSHSSLLTVPNKLFYDDELVAKGNPDIINAAANWQGLKRKGFPVIFHGVEGLDEREGNSPSFFNRQEIEVVCDYIQKIQTDRIAVGKDIGVVTPYNQQVKKMRKAFEISRLFNVDVGSVEQFQGQERKVIIISTVRSRFEFIEFDYMFQLGFLKNPKRFNVAVTRARSLLIVVGNPKVLQHDQCWRALIEHCIANDSYAGIPFKFAEVNKSIGVSSIEGRVQDMKL